MAFEIIDNEKNKTILICFILFQFMDSVSYINVFKYLYELFDFNPYIIHMDYEKALITAIHKTECFIKDIIHIKCYFQFVKSLSEYLKKSNKSKKYLSKDSINIKKHLINMFY